LRFVGGRDFRFFEKKLGKKLPKNSFYVAITAMQNLIFENF
jgi:hypothetical protein